MVHVLVPVDDSDRAMNALEFVLENYPDASITALHVINPSTFPAGGFESGITTDLDSIRKNKRNQAEQLLETFRERAADRGVGIETAIVTGKPTKRIVDYAEDNDADVITIGSHGRTGASRVLLGSVAEAVVRRSPIPVTVVR